jgi:hypothetical protein
MLSFPMTRQLISALIVVFVSVMGAQAQSEDVAKVLMELENAWVDALVKADPAKLDAILVDTYVDTEEGGHHNAQSQLPVRFAERNAQRSGTILSMIPLLSGSPQATRRIRRNNSVKYYGKILSISR